MTNFMTRISRSGNAQYNLDTQQRHLLLMYGEGGEGVAPGITFGVLSKQESKGQLASNAVRVGGRDGGRAATGHPWSGTNVAMTPLSVAPETIRAMSESPVWATFRSFALKSYGVEVPDLTPDGQVMLDFTAGPEFIGLPVGESTVMVSSPQFVAAGLRLVHAHVTQNAPRVP